MKIIKMNIKRYKEIIRKKDILTGGMQADRLIEKIGQEMGKGW